MRGRKTFALFLISKYLNVKEVHEDLGVILIQKDAVASARTIPQLGRQTDGLRNHSGLSERGLS